MLLWPDVAIILFVHAAAGKTSRAKTCWYKGLLLLAEAVALLGQPLKTVVRERASIGRHYPARDSLLILKADPVIFNVGLAATNLLYLLVLSLSPGDPCHGHLFQWSK